MSPISDQANAIIIARLEIEVAYLKVGMADLKATNAQQNAKLDAILGTMAEARGGWRTLLLIGGASSTVGGFLSWAITHWKG